MAFHLNVVVDEPMDFDDRGRQSVRLIGEILPFVLAKYAGEQPAADQVRRRRFSPHGGDRFGGGNATLSFDF